MTNIDIERFNNDFKDLKKKEFLEDLPQSIRELTEDALVCEDNEEFDKAEEICRKLLKENPDKNLEQVKIILARIYPKLLYTDVEFGNKRYVKDVEAYFSFLDSIKMNTLLRDHLADTIIRLGSLMENKWYRPLFAKFIKRIEDKGYLEGEEYEKVIESAYCSMESYGYFADIKVSMMIKNFLKACYDKEFMVREAEVQNGGNNIMVDYLTYEWYLCKYIDTHKDEIDYIRESYPYSYKLIDSEIKDDTSDKALKQETIINELMKYTADGIESSDLAEVLEKSYKQITDDSVQSNKAGKSVVVHCGEGTYRRSDYKVGRNDLCPCGSGKKYKFCCGK